MSSRWISHTEISTMLTCPARWAFRYGGQLTDGQVLKEKVVVPMLSEGRAWGAAIAAWHVNAGHVDANLHAIEAMDDSLERDAEQQREHGVHDEDAHKEMRERLLKLLIHHTDLVEPTPMEGVEEELLVSLPSRTGIRSSSRYKFLGYVDALERDDQGGVWIDEFKLRGGNLTPVNLIVNSRQIRWYAWAYERQFGEPVQGVWFNERLNEVPKLPRMVKTGKKDGSVRPSHAVDQVTTKEAYLAACAEYDETPSPATVEALEARRWQQRVPVVFRPGELVEAGRELVSAARLIHLHETGELWPLRSVKPPNCNRCPYKMVCPDPAPDLVESLFVLGTPKGELDGDDHQPKQPAAAEVPW